MLDATYHPARSDSVAYIHGLSGKTTAVSMYAAVLLAIVPDMWISVFSTGQRASSSLLEQTAKFFRMLKNDVRKIPIYPIGSMYVYATNANMLA